MLKKTLTAIAFAVVATTSFASIPDQPKVEPLDEFQLSEIKCLARNIYFEARGESDLGQIAVAWVTVNRMKHAKFPDTICGVVYQPSQFSWTISGKNRSTPHNGAWAKAQSLAQKIYLNPGDDPTEGATFYHANWVNPSWRNHMDLSAIIGVHKFYFWDGKW